MILDIILKKYYEEPVDTAEDVRDRNLTVLWSPGSESLVGILKNSPFNITRTLAERTVVAKVIFCNNSILFLNFHKRIGMKWISWSKMQKRAVLLLLKCRFFTLNGWISGDGTEVKTGKMV